MTSKSKIKGNKFERDIVKAVELHEVKCVRAWGSNGASIGQHPEVDILIDDDIKVQAKVRKALPKWIKPSEEVDIQVIKEDRGKIYVVQELNDWLVNLKENK
jgi:Holliday junction resolvase